MGTDTETIVIGDLGAAETSSAVVIDDDANENPLPKSAVLNEDGTVTLKLRVDVKLQWRKPGGEVTEDKYSEFVMRRLKGKDMVAIQECPKAQVAMVSMAQSIGIPKARFQHIFERMDAADIQAAGGVVMYFLNNGPTTGP